MAKWKTTSPARKPQKEQVNKKALQITLISLVSLIVILGALIIFTNN